jgi:hypothetical protein
MFSRTSIFIPSLYLCIPLKLICLNVLIQSNKIYNTSFSICIQFEIILKVTKLILKDQNLRSTNLNRQETTVDVNRHRTI